ncbi:putative disease resistance protein At4g19050 isoform X2 [Diospyros lotus]|uniref:putative disease resistance protein At4g19050 isoform X2 n=1 Tax=Diospyros lotus TaxID=55363 RepID=UPI002257821A|nr:putative disease resistance protein At4g19050 isoform X2 [Diospyros lotus]
MATSTVVQRKKEIFQLLKDDKVRSIILYGEAGVGKTWTARQMANLARKSGKIDIALWVFLSREYDNDALRSSIVYQLSLHSITGFLESEDNQQQMPESLEGKKLLLVLDDEGSKMSEQQIFSQLETLLKLPQQNYKILITTRNNPSSDAEDRKIIEVKCLSGEAEAKALLHEKLGPVVYEVPCIKVLAEQFIDISRPLPAAIILMEKAIRYFAQQDSGVQKLRHYLEETPGNKIYDTRQLLRCGYDLLPNEILIDCCWSGSHFFQVRQRVHYKELIAYWMMEGYLGCINSMDKAYERGHQVLLELIDCHILREVEVDYVMMDERTTLNLDDVVMERATMNSDDCYRRGFGGTANLGLANVFGDGNWKGLGRLTLKDGAMEALCGDKQAKLCTLLFDGNSLHRVFPSDFFQSQQELQVLALLNPTLSTYLSLCTMHDLSVLVLRFCHFLEKIDRLGGLKFEKLTVLEISGPSSIRQFPDEFFKSMPELQSLNLSFLQIKSLPSSVYELSNLSWLILRECCQLEKLERLTKCTKLMVLDLSGAKSLALISDKKLSGFKELQVLNLSETKVAKLPLLNGLQKLTHLSLRGCLMLDRLCGINAVTSLQVLDLSNASRFREFHDQSLAGIKGLKIIDLSATPIKNLPANIGSPRHLYLKGCRELETLECIQKVKDLATLDLSDCTSLKELHAKSFEHMSCLLRLDLSGTKITVVPDLSKLCNLRHLLLKNCSDLSDVPQLGSLTKLVELNLHGIRSLRRADFVEHMNRLQILDLSGTQLEQLPSRSRLENLNELYLRGCPCLIEVPDWLTNLPVLDLPATGISLLPNMKNQGASSSNIEEQNPCGWGISVLPVAIVDGLWSNTNHCRDILCKDPSRLEQLLLSAGAHMFFMAFNNERAGAAKHSIFHPELVYIC